MTPLPRYGDLPVSAGAPPASSWGVWGPEDELGTLNLLTDERTLAAVREVRRGAVFPLQLPLHEPEPGIVWRTRPVHHVHQPGFRGDGGAGIDRDDHVDGLWLQGSSQWDGLAHVRHPEHGNYNGVPDDDVHGGPGARLGIDRWAARGVVGRGVLVDVARFLAQQGDPLDLRSAREITPDELDAALAAQGIALRPGDVLLLHTGWMAHVMALPVEERRPLLDPRTQAVPGLAVRESTLEWLWDHHVAAVAADNAGVEACGRGLRFDLHPSLLALLGIPLGEYWWLRDLAADCAVHETWSCLLVSVPLHLRGAIGSPAQAVAIR